MDVPFEVYNVYAQSVELELTEPMALSFGTVTSRPSGWLTMSCDVDGRPVVGHGEGATLPQAVFTDDCGPNIAGNMRSLVRAVHADTNKTVGGALDSVQAHRFRDGGRYPTARLAVEMAILDAATRASGISMKEVIGVPADITEVPYGKSIGGATAGAILRQAEEALDNNARKIKIKVSPKLFDSVTVAIDVLQREQTNVDIMVDANGGFDPTSAEDLRMIEKLDDCGLLMIEEPVSRVGEIRGLDAVRALHRALPNLTTTICLDDCLQTFEDCQTALDERLAHIINVKPGRIGSFLQAIRLVDLATSKHAEVMVGGMLEATPGRAMTTLLGAYCLHKGCTIPGDLSLAQERLTEDFVSPAKQLRLSPRGGIIVPSGPGWGF
ncbi:MAG TPA: enolase C-terminal domain-like protein [Candidatus Saccharimonadales bacterium]|nr:enolase C-terminal domain-like protein [Candidatus Saccharimonadales bacterium]